MVKSVRVGIVFVLSFGGLLGFTLMLAHPTAQAKPAAQAAPADIGAASRAGELAPARLTSAITPTLSFLTSFGGEGGDLVVNGDFVYVADGTQLVIYNAVDPANPQPVARLRLPGAVRQIEVNGGRAYISTGGGGLLIYDVTVPSVPRRLAQYQAGTQVEHFIKEDNLVYAIVVTYYYTSALQVIDVSNPLSPTLRGDVFAWGEQIFKRGNWFYAGSNVIDVTNPDLPVIRAKLEGTIVGVDNQYAYVENLGCGMHGCDGFVYIYDISIPASPSKLGAYEIYNSIAELSSFGSVLYLASGAALDIVDISDPNHPAMLSRYTGSYVAAFTVMSDTVFIPGNGFVILDTHDPANPSLVGAYTASSTVYELRLAGSRAYVRATDLDGMDRNELHVVDLTDLANPALLGMALYWDPNQVTEFQVVGQTACLLSNNPLFQVLDFANAAAPAFLGTHFVSQTGIAWDLQVIGSTVYLVTGAGRFSLFDISNPRQPAYLYSYHDGVWVWRAYVNANALAYLVVDDYGSYRENLQIVDFSQPLTPTLLMTYYGPPYKEFSALGGTTNRAFLGYLDGAVQIIDTSDPVHPTMTGVYTITDGLLTLQAAGDTLYLANSRRFEIVDISNPISPTLTGWYPLNGDVHSLDVVDGWAYVSVENLGVLLLDIHNPANPVLVQTYPTNARHVQVDGGLLYIAAAEDGVQVVSLYPPSMYLPVVFSGVGGP